MRRSKSMIVVAVAVSAVGVGAWHKRLYIQLSLAGAGGLGAAVTTREFFHAPGGVDEFLFAGEKRMARGADPDFNVPFSRAGVISRAARDRKSTRLNSSHRCISYAVFCLKKKKDTKMQ